MRIALIGNPNSGKTTIYNELTGKNEKVGNWAGVSIDKRESRIKKKYDKEGNVVLVDLPGTYSLSPYTSEEGVTRDYILKEKPDVILNVVDATNLSRSLFFTTQLLELGIPLVVALNKSDVKEKKETRIDTKLLSEKLACPVVETNGISGNGLQEVIETLRSIQNDEQKVIYQNTIENKEEADRDRFDHVNQIVKDVEQRKNEQINSMTDTIDSFLTHPVFGLAFFALVMTSVFYISQTTVGTWVAEWFVGYIETFQEWVSQLLQDTNPFVQALIADGIIGGVGAVVGFLPLIMIMYFLITLLEDCGYMARATVVLDPIFKRVGLSGKSVIPMVIGTGCGIPAIMACRTIKNERERRSMVMLATFMPCGAKLPVIALFAGAFFPEALWIGPLMYFIGIALILLGAVLIKAINGSKFKKSFFIMELPEYKLPNLKLAIRSMFEQGKAYILKAGTIILVCNTLVQVMQSFNWSFELIEEGMESTSILASIAGPFSILLVPIVGVAAWQLAAASIAGFIAKENIVGTIATCYAITNFIDTEELELIGSGNSVAAVIGITKVAALAYLIFNLFTPPCFAAIGAMNAELQSKKWLAGAIGLQLMTGYTLGYLVYQFGTLFTTGHMGQGLFLGMIPILGFIFTTGFLIIKNNRG
ncbi:MAG: ferrous iron transporter B [Bacillota bacterium]|nr:ferrous iron transporter B [Bacillota bacterium]